LMERHRLTAKQAFATLVEASQERHMKLREVAARVNVTGQRPTPQYGRTHAAGQLSCAVASCAAPTSLDSGDPRCRR
jgi:hypothetical protein